MAAITVKDISQLDKILDAKIRTALENTRKMIGSSIQKTVSKRSCKPKKTGGFFKFPHINRSQKKGEFLLL